MKLLWLRLERENPPRVKSSKFVRFAHAPVEASCGRKREPRGPRATIELREAEPIHSCFSLVEM